MGRSQEEEGKGQSRYPSLAGVSPLSLGIFPVWLGLEQPVVEWPRALYPRRL